MAPPEQESAGRHSALIGRIDRLVEAGRATWFTFLAVLAFVSIAFLQLTPASFYGAGLGIELPLIGTEVPPHLFLTLAPALTALVYCYFHVSQLRLWDAFARLRRRQAGDAVSEHLPPWMILDAGLWLWSRATRRPGSRPLAPRALAGVGESIVVLVAWVLPVVVVAAYWRMALAARLPAPALVGLVALGASLYVGITTFVVFLRRARRDTGPTSHIVLEKGWPAAVALGVAGGLLISTLTATGVIRDRGHSALTGLLPLDLSGARLVQLPPGWSDPDIAERDFAAARCARDPALCKLDGREAREDYRDEWRNRRGRAIAVLDGFATHPATLDRAVLRTANLTGLAATDMSFDRADASQSVMEGARLTDPSASAADFSDASLALSTLTGGALTDSDFGGASFDFAEIRDTDFTGGRFFDTSFRFATLHGVDFSGAILSRPYFEGAYLQDTDFTGAFLLGVAFPGAERATEDGIYNAEVFQHDTLVSGRYLPFDRYRNSFRGLALPFPGYDLADLRESTIFGSTLSGAGLRFLDAGGFDQAELKEAFGDGSVQLTNRQTRPAHWPIPILSDVCYFGIWRHWREAQGLSWPPSAAIGDMRISAARADQNATPEMHTRIPAPSSRLPRVADIPAQEKCAKVVTLTGPDGNSIDVMGRPPF